MTVQSFEEYVAAHGIQLSEYGAAFAAYLHEVHGWDGDFERAE
jgi:hypothetical protein